MNRQDNPFDASGRILSVLASFCLLFLVSCQPSPEDVRKWKDYEGGEKRLANLIADPERPMELRIVAAETLVEAGAVFDLANAMKNAPERDREPIIAGLAPKLLAGLQGKAGAKVEARDAKDAVYYVGGYAPEGIRAELARAVVAWAVEDFKNRYNEGKTTLGQVLPQLGTIAVAPLLDLVRKGVEIPQVVEIILRINDPKATEVLVATLLDAARKAMPAIPETLVAGIEKVDHPALTPFLVEVVANHQVDLDTRGRFLDHIVRCKGQEAAGGLLRLLSDTDARWVAAQHLVILEGAAGLEKVLAHLPPPGPDAYPEGEDELAQSVEFFCRENVQNIKKTGDEEKVRKALREALRSRNPVARGTAAFCLGLHGKAEDIPALEALRGDGARLPNWKDGGEVGAIARAAIEAIKSRG